MLHAFSYLHVFEHGCWIFAIGPLQIAHRTSFALQIAGATQREAKCWWIAVRAGKRRAIYIYRLIFLRFVFYCILFIVCYVQCVWQWRMQGDFGGSEAIDVDCRFCSPCSGTDASSPHSHRI